MHNLLRLKEKEFCIYHLYSFVFKRTCQIIQALGLFTWISLNVWLDTQTKYIFVLQSLMALLTVYTKFNLMSQLNVYLYFIFQR